MRIQTWILILATAPGYGIGKVAVSAYSNAAVVVQIVVAVIEVVAGSRTHLLGLLAFQTLPSREIVSIWQMCNVLIGSFVAFLVIILGYSSANTIPSIESLVVGSGIVEGIRLVFMVALWFVHGKENLATL
eukprot:gene8794-33663_t